MSSPAPILGISGFGRMGRALFSALVMPSGVVPIPGITSQGMPSPVTPNQVTPNRVIPNQGFPSPHTPLPLSRFRLYDPTADFLNPFLLPLIEAPVLSRSNAHLAQESDVLFCCTKPKVVPLVCKEWSRGIHSKDPPHRPLVISIAAGIPLNALQSMLPPRTPVIRAMPNLPAVVGEAAAAYASGDHVERHHEELFEGLMGAVAPVLLKVEKERDLDLVTALSGSGPVFVATFLDALIQGAVQLGLPKPRQSSWHSKR